MNLNDWLKGTGSSAAPDGFSFSIDHPLAAEHAAISQLLVEYERASASAEWCSVDSCKLQTYARIAERIDSFFLRKKKWPLETWLVRYLEHPLVGTLARRLIWNFTTDGVSTPGLWLNGKLVDRMGRAVGIDAVRTLVSLWHPLDQPPDVVLGWRGFLQEWEIRQPFKQAHREVYRLTNSEEKTGTYSNRFASHILKQHQFHALCASRGWKNKLRLMVDDEYPPATRLLPEWGLRAEYWIEGASHETAADLNESGAFLYLTTDQVRFYEES